MESLHAGTQQLARFAGRAVERMRIRGIPRILHISAPMLLGRGVQTLESVSGVRIVVDVQDYSSCMMFYARYSPAILSLMRSIVSPGWSVVDVGAQIGYVAAHLARLVGPRGKVYSFEPDPNAVERLRRTIQENGTGHVTAFPVAVGNKAGELTFNVSPTLGWSTAVAGTHHKDLRPIKVQSVRIDDMASTGSFRRPVRFIKIDVEGFECSVLDGMSQLMHEDSPLVLAEVNPLMLRPNGDTVPELLRRLSNHGQRLFVVSERHGLLSGGQAELRPVSPDAELPFCDVLSVPTDFQLPASLRMTV